MSDTVSHLELARTFKIVAKLRRARGDTAGAARAERSAKILTLSRMVSIVHYGAGDLGEATRDETADRMRIRIAAYPTIF